MITPASMMTNAKRATAGWVALHTENYDHGGSAGSSYTTGPASGWTHGGDYGYAPRIRTGLGETDRCVSFPVQSEQNGSNHSYYSCRADVTAAYFSTNACKTKFRMDWSCRTPATGAPTTSNGGGAGSTFAGLCTLGNSTGSRNMAFYVRNTNELAFLKNCTAGASASPTYATTPTATASVTLATNTWYQFSIRIYLHATEGYFEAWVNGTRQINVTGGVTFDAGTANEIASTSYFRTFAGTTSSNSDLTRFGLLDTMQTYKWV